MPRVLRSFFVSLLASLVALLISLKVGTRDPAQLVLTVIVVLIGVWGLLEMGWRLLGNRVEQETHQPAYVDLGRYLRFDSVARETVAPNDFGKRLAVVCKARSRMPTAVRCELRLIELQIRRQKSWETPGWFKPVRLIWTTDTFDTVIHPGGSAECDVVRRDVGHGRSALIWTQDFHPFVNIIPSGLYRARLSLDGLGCRSKVAEQRFRWQEPEGLGRVRGSLEWE